MAANTKVVDIVAAVTDIEENGYDRLMIADSWVTVHSLSQFVIWSKQFACSWLVSASYFDKST